MSFTLSNVKTAAQARGYASDTGGSQTEIVKTALRRLYGMRRWRFLETRATPALVVGTDNLAVATIGNVRGLDAVRMFDPVSGEGLALDYTDPQTLADLRSAAGVTRDTPRYWTRQGTTLRFDCAPDKAYTLQVDYITLPSLPAVDGDTVNWPDEYMDVLVEALVMGLAYRERDWTARAVAETAYATRIREMADEENQAQRQTSTQVAQWDGWDNLSDCC